MQEYDYIIIGGGSAGCLLARLLVEVDCGKIALIETGNFANGKLADVRTVVPAYYPKTFGSCLDWAFLTEPQAGLNSRRIGWPRGKTLGGSGAINAMIYMQAAHGDFNRWAEAGCTGWDWPSIEASLMSTSSLSRCPVSNLELSPIAEPHPWTHAFLDACNAYGLNRKERWLQAEANRSGQFTLTQCAGRRHHTGQQLAEIVPNARLDLFLGSNVQSLKVSGDRVQRVSILNSANKLIELSVGGEVIMCAGTIGSPTVLLRSGIGPAASLRRLGIDVQCDLAGVGENLQDHLVYPLVYRTRTSDGMPTRFSVADRQQFRIQAPGSTHGPLASNIAEAGAMFAHNSLTLRSHDSTAVEKNHAENRCGGGVCRDRESPDFQIHFTPTHYLKYPSRTAPKDCFSLAVTDLHPRSRGRLQLVNSAPNVAPRIDPGYLMHAEDTPRLLSAIETCRQIANQASLSILVAEEVLPGIKRIEASSVSRSVQMYARSIYHPVGTCRMGTDTNAVVDPEMRVHGFSNLHVADASVLPDLPSANTNAVTLLLAVKKFEKLKEARS